MKLCFINISLNVYWDSCAPQLLYSIAHRILGVLQFEQIVDFLNENPIKYALTVNLTIYTSCIEQFWSTVKAKTVNEEVQLQALVDGKKIVVTEASVRRDLQLEVAEGVDFLPNATIFEQLTLMGESHTSKRKSIDEAVNGIGEITFPRVSGFDKSFDTVIIRLKPSIRSLRVDSKIPLVKFSVQPFPWKNIYAKNGDRSVHNPCGSEILHPCGIGTVFSTYEPNKVEKGIEEDGHTQPKKYSELTEAQQLQDDCDVQATNIIIYGLPPDVYALVNHQEAAKDIWDRVRLLMKGTKLSYHKRECRLYNLFDKFASVQGETFKERTRLTASTKQWHFYLLWHQGFHLQTINSECLLIPEIRQPFKMEESQFNKFKEDKLRVLLALEKEELLQPQGEIMQPVKQRL
ncbi:hypothetical protein Tco_0885823 [Tanacetum coccineum]